MKRILLLILIFTGSIGFAFSQCVTNAGPDITICGNEQVGLGGIIPAGSTSLWVGGLGNFNPNRNDPLAVYTPDASEIGQSVSLILSTSGGGCPQGADTMVINVNNTPDLFNLDGFVLNVCPSASVDLSSVNIVDSNNASGTITYEDAAFNPLPSTIVTSGGIYYVRKRTNSQPPCEDFVSVAVIINVCAGCSNPPSLSSTESDVNCYGQSNGSIDVSLSGGVPPVSYAWSNGASTEDITGLSAGVYTVTVTDNENCTAELTVNVNEPADLDASIFTLDTTAYCNVFGGGVLLESAVNPNVTKQWYKKTNPIAGATGDTYFANSAAWYQLEVTDVNGCTKKANAIVVTKLPRPPASITVIGDLSFCGGGSVTLQANAGPYTYEWLKAGSIYPGRTDPTLVVTKAGKYKVSVINEYGCYRRSAEVRAVRWQNPKSVVTPTTAQLPSPICDGDSILLTCTPSRGTPPYTFQWIRYTTIIAGVSGPTYISTNTGGYSCRVIDSNGCAQKSFPRTVITETCRLGDGNYVLPNHLHLAAYPNPFKNEITLALNNFSDEKVKIMVKDAIGKLIYESEEAPQFEYKLNSSAYKSGLYIIELYQGTNVQRIKMIKSE